MNRTQRRFSDRILLLLCVILVCHFPHELWWLSTIWINNADVHLIGCNFKCKTRACSVVRLASRLIVTQLWYSRDCVWISNRILRYSKVSDYNHNQSLVTRQPDTNLLWLFGQLTEITIWTPYYGVCILIHGLHSKLTSRVSVALCRSLADRVHSIASLARIWWMLWQHCPPNADCQRAPDWCLVKDIICPCFPTSFLVLDFSFSSVI